MAGPPAHKPRTRNPPAPVCQLGTNSAATVITNAAKDSMRPKRAKRSISPAADGGPRAAFYKRAPATGSAELAASAGAGTKAGTARPAPVLLALSLVCSLLDLPGAGK
jgi:hypothetical protein